MGTNIQTAGTAIGGSAGFALSHTALTSYVPGTIYTQSWYQPKYAETYSSTELRRYNGGGDGNAASKIRAYCVGLRDILSTETVDFTAADDAGIAGVVTLSGASALAAGLAFGVASLAF